MNRRRLISAIVGLLLVIVIAATTFVGPGIRHTHEGGDHSHSHSGSHAVTQTDDSARPHSHSHGPGGHVHTHGHASHHSHASHSHRHASHSHSHPHSHTTAEDAGEGGEIHDARTHVHITIMGFEFTLPDFLASDEAESTKNASVNERKPADAASVETVTITRRFTVTQLVQVLLLQAAPLPEHAVLPAPERTAGPLSVWCLYSGRLRDAPESPPPEFA